MVKEWFLVPHLLLDLLVSVIQGNLFSALPHDGFCVAVAAKQGESWLLKQSHKGFCSERSKAAISASPDSCLFSKEVVILSPLTRLWALLSWLRIKRHCEHICQGVSLPFSNEEILLCGLHTAHKISSSHQSLFLKKQQKNTPPPNKTNKQKKKLIKTSISYGICHYPGGEQCGKENFS